ncbi:hypothetical protein CRM22_000327 [Opisthorchis felineus]|uniref:AAA+ ATPase domain-containing protein n=1 Tax=Opisthorchis felineus TaxID=147828 RepID=A0A4S2MFG1_OPIFE|nr:hypothetical protein CRM22_000327 [Opisthorchis felineus]
MLLNSFRNPETFSRLGAKLPKGVLLVNSPGVSKTLSAKAVSGEAQVPFLYVSGSRFEEVFVGVGASRVRQLFTAAKQHALCLIFIDEIDSVGHNRTCSPHHPYANQTINQLLEEMDGFQSTEVIIILGATNPSEDLDKALLRPGRFNVQIHVSPPTFEERVALLKLYLHKIKTAPDFDIIRRTKDPRCAHATRALKLLAECSNKSTPDAYRLNVIHEFKVHITHKRRMCEFGN